LSLCAVLLVAASVYLALQPRWLGIEFAGNAQTPGLQITGLSPDHPNAGSLRVGDEVSALINGQGQTVPLRSRTLLEDPDVLPSYSELEDFFRQQSALTQALQTPPLRLLLASGQTAPVTTTDLSLKNLPVYYWWQVLIGFACFLIGASVWAYRPGLAAARMLFVSSIGALGFTTLSAVYSSRALALDGDLFRVLLIATHFSTILHTSALLAMVWVYPRVLGGRRVPVAIFATGGAVWLLDSFQLVPSSLWSHYLFTSAAFAVGLIFVAGQWRATRQRPVERAIMRWFVMAVFFASLANILILKAPLFFGNRPAVGQGWVFIAQLLMYVGLALGVIRYRLFDLERWWFRTWLWFLAGLTVVAVDLALLVILNINHSDALLVSLLLAGWLYFPMRQWVWSRLMPASHSDMSALLTKMTTNLIEAGTATRIQAQWPDMLQDIFTPLELHEQPEPCSDVTIADYGSLLLVPALNGSHSLALYYPAAGRRLFSPQDLKRARVLFDLAQHAASAARAREEGARAERSRIMRDLHDDLGARLLSLVYTTENEKSQYLAQAAIDDLHGVLAAAKDTPTVLSAAINNWCSEGRRRLQESGIQGEFSVAAELSSVADDILLPARVHVNIERVLREAISNSVRHGRPDTIRVEFTQSPEGGLVLIVTDDGKATDPEHWQHGHGLQTIQARALEIGAVANWLRPSAGGCEFRLHLGYGSVSPR
jgi:signal transduction histidine kinase